jgi:hypothetical protein
MLTPSRADSDRSHTICGTEKHTIFLNIASFRALDLIVVFIPRAYHRNCRDPKVKKFLQKSEKSSQKRYKE